MNQNFMNSVKIKKPTKSYFDLSHDVKLSGQMGDLIPTFWMDCVPGDKIRLGCESLLRFAPLISPVMHQFSVTMHYYFVPYRILWNHWEDWILQTGQDQIYTHPYVLINAANYNGVGSIADYLGIPIPIGAEEERVSAFPFAAYNKIRNEYYRDQNLQTMAPDTCIDGDNTAVVDFMELYTCAWEHDYFTSCLPFAQKGTAIEIPVVQNFPDVPVNRNTATGGPTILDGTPADQTLIYSASVTPGITNDAIYAKTSLLNTTATTINDLRTAFRLQEWLEKNARVGTRYIESILGHFGVRSSDKRLQRPEYITGTKSPVVISEVLNTTGTEEAPQGNMAGHGISVTAGKYGQYYCEEHGIIMGLMLVRPRPAYQQGIHKSWLTIDDPTQKIWPTFAHLGEQPVLNKEIYAFQGAAEGNEPFGYLPNYGWARTMPARVAGEFRTTLNFWHAGRIFLSPPALNATFISCDPTDRIFAVEEGEKMYVQILHKIDAIRPLPKFGTPTY